MRVREGDPITAEDFNAIAERLERFLNLSVSGGHLQLWDGPDGKHVALHVPVETLALLSGTSSPYSFQEVDEAAGGGFAVRAVGDSCSGCVYEINSVPNLGGTYQRITWTEAGDWRFQFVGVGSEPCNPGTTIICATITSDGCGGVAYGALITVKNGSGTIVGTCTATGVITAVALGASGSGYTNGTGYALGIHGGNGGGATGTFDVIAGQVTNVQLTDGGSGFTSAPTISFPGAGGGSGATATATVRGRCCVEVPASGSYTVTAEIPGASAVSATTAVACNSTSNVSLSFPPDSVGTACIHFEHCGYAHGGDTVSITGAGTATGTTDSDGDCCFRLGVGSYSYSLTTPQGTTKSGTFHVSGCATTNVNAGFSITRFCIGVRTDPPAGCTATITVKNLDTGATLGTGSLTTAFDGFIYYGEVCIPILEIINTQINDFQVVMAWMKFTHVISESVLCYSPSAPLFVDSGGAAAPC